MSSSNQHDPSSSRSSQQSHPPIHYRFPDPTDPDQFIRPQTDSLIESPPNSSPRITTTQSDTDWSILSINPKNPCTQQQDVIQPTTPQQTTHQELPASMPSEDQVKCQQWIKNLPDKESDTLYETIIQTVLLNNHANQENLINDNQQILDSSQYTTELGPNDSASQCIYHNPSLRTNHLNLSYLPIPQNQPVQAIEELPAIEYPLDPSMDLSSAYLTPDQLSSILSHNHSPPQASTTLSSEPKIVPKNVAPRSSLSSRPSSSCPPSNHSAPQPTSSTIIPPQPTPTSPVQPPESNKKPAGYPIKSICCILLFFIGTTVFVYQSDYLLPPSSFQDPLTRGSDSTERLFQSTRLKELTVGLSTPVDKGSVEEENPPITSPNEIPYIVPYTRSSEPEQILPSQKVTEPVQHLELSPSSHDIIQPVSLTTSEPSPEKVSGSSHLVDEPLSTCHDEVADPMAVPALNDTPQDELENETDQTISCPTDHHLPSPDYALWMTVFAILYLLVRWIFGRGQIQEDDFLSVERILSGLTSQNLNDCPRSFRQLETSLEKISKDERQMKRLKRTLENQIRMQEFHRIERGLLAWTKAVEGEKVIARKMWERFWAPDCATIPTKSAPHQAIWLSLVEQLGQDYRELSYKADSASSSVVTLKPHHRLPKTESFPSMDSHLCLKPDPDLSSPPLINPSRTRKNSKRETSHAPTATPIDCVKHELDSSGTLESSISTTAVPIRKPRPKSISTTHSTTLPLRSSSRKSEPLVNSNLKLSSTIATPQPSAPSCKTSVAQIGVASVRSSPRLRTKLERKK